MRRMILASALALAVAACSAQEQPRLRLLVGLDLSAAGVDVGAYADALAASISRSSLVGEVLRASGDGDIAMEAGRLGCDVALAASLAEAGSGLRQSWRIVGAASGEEIGSGSADAERPDARSLSDFFWLDLVASFEAAIGTIDRLEAVRLVVGGPPGARVAGIGAETIVIPEESSIEVRVKAPATYSWRASAKGYDQSEGIVAVLGQGPAVLNISLARQRSWTLDAGLYNGAFVDSWVSYRFADDRFFVRAGFRQYILGFSLVDAEPGLDPSYFVSTPLIQLGLGGGALLGRPGQRVRTYAGALATTRVAFPAGAGVFIDPVAPLCVEPFGGLEWKPLARWGFFGELYADLYLLSDEILFAASIKDRDDPSPLYIFGDGWIFNLPNLRFGARLYL